MQWLVRFGRFGVRTPLGENFSFLFTCPDRSWGTPSPLFNRRWNFFLQVERPMLGIEHPHHLEPRLSIGRSTSLSLLYSLQLVCLYTRGAQVFQNHGGHLKIPGTRYVSWSKFPTENLQTLETNVKSSPHCDPTSVFCTSLLSTKTSEFNSACPEKLINGYQCTGTTRNVVCVQYRTVDSVQHTGISVMDQSLSWPFF